MLNLGTSPIKKLADVCWPGMAIDNKASYFNILAPGESEFAMFNGSVGEHQFEGVLPEAGDYKTGST